MLKLNQTGTNFFTIVDNDGCEVMGTKEELEQLCQQIENKVENGLSQKKKDTHKDIHIVILENDGTNEKVQMELSDSAYELLCYLYDEDWFDSDDIHFTELDEKKIERFI